MNYRNYDSQLLFVFFVALKNQLLKRFFCGFQTKRRRKIVQLTIISGRSEYKIYQMCSVTADVSKYQIRFVALLPTSSSNFRAYLRSVEIYSKTFHYFVWTREDTMQYVSLSVLSQINCVRNAKRNVASSLLTASFHSDIRDLQLHDISRSIEL